jgi:acetyl-CoA/propionyl-CoA carboxylase biotin carboxyl carrier protein
VSGRRFDVKVIGAAENGAGAAPAPGATGARKAPPRRRERAGASAAADGALVSPLQGTVLRVAVEKGAEVAEGALVCVIEAMKMENEITAPVAGKVEELNVSEGASVGSGDTIAVIK